MCMMLSFDSSKYTQFAAEENKKQLKGSNYFFNASAWEHIQYKFNCHSFVHSNFLNTCSVPGTLLATRKLSSEQENVVSTLCYVII